MSRVRVRVGSGLLFLLELLVKLSTRLATDTSVSILRTGDSGRGFTALWLAAALKEATRDRTGESPDDVCRLGLVAAMTRWKAEGALPELESVLGTRWCSSTGAFLGPTGACFVPALGGACLTPVFEGAVPGLKPALGGCTFACEPIFTPPGFLAIGATTLVGPGGGVVTLSGTGDGVGVGVAPLGFCSSFSGLTGTMAPLRGLACFDEGMGNGGAAAFRIPLALATIRPCGDDTARVATGLP